MATLFYNHLHVSGPSERIEEFKRWSDINEDMINVADAENAADFDEEENRERHQKFIDFIWSGTQLRVDRIRLKSGSDNELHIAFDSWGGQFADRTHWMAENWPDLAFDLTYMKDGHCHSQLIFESDKWLCLFHETPVDGPTDTCIGSSGRYADYRNREDQGDSNEIDDELAEFRASYPRTDSWEWQIGETEFGSPIESFDVDVVPYLSGRVCLIFRNEAKTAIGHAWVENGGALLKKLCDGPTGWPRVRTLRRQFVNHIVGFDSDGNEVITFEISSRHACEELRKAADEFDRPAPSESNEDFLKRLQALSGFTSSSNGNSVAADGGGDDSESKDENAEI
jgi:hypothetical protein